MMGWLIQKFLCIGYKISQPLRDHLSYSRPPRASLNAGLRGHEAHGLLKPNTLPLLLSSNNQAYTNA